MIRFIIAALSTMFLTAAANADDAAPSNIKDGITHITIHAHNLTAKEAFDEIARQAHVEFADNGNVFSNMNLRNFLGHEVKKTIDVDLTDRPFWPAVSEICDQYDLSIQPSYNNDRRIMLINSGQKNSAPKFEKDGILVQAMSFSRQQNINYAYANQSMNSCGVQVMVYLDPALKASAFDQNFKTDSAVDEAGNSWAPDANQGRFGGGMQPGSLVYNCLVPLKYPDNPGKKLTSLKFSLSMQTSEETDSLTVDKPLEAEETTKDFGDVTVTFHSLKKNGSGYELKIGMSVRGAAEKLNNAFGLIQSGKLTDENGKSYNSFGGGGGGSNNKLEYTFNYGFNGGGTPPGEPVKWVLEIPTKTHELSVPVEFTDLPLP